MKIKSGPLGTQVPEGSIRLRGVLAYDGKNFNGWGYQDDVRTVQGVVEESIAQVLRIPRMHVQCAGRTDAGVHARGQVVHFDVPQMPLPPMDDLVYKFNSLLPYDVAFSKIDIAHPDFDARFAALSRSYTYLIHEGPRDPLLRDRVYRHWDLLDVEAMHEASQHLLGLHNFASFCRKREGATTIRTLMKFDWSRTEDGLIRADVQADAFCYSMVRGLVGAAVTVGEGKRDVNWLKEYLEGEKRLPEIFAVPAWGLTFESVEYPPEEEFRNRIGETLNMRAPYGTP